MARKKPKPGDLLCVLKSDDTLIKKGSCGIIEGEEGKSKKYHSVTFNPYTPWWDRGFIQASGGPVRRVSSKKMIPTGKKKKQEFQYFPGLPAAGAAKIKEKTVNVFEVDLTK